MGVGGVLCLEASNCSAVETPVKDKRTTWYNRNRYQKTKRFILLGGNLLTICFCGGFQQCLVVLKSLCRGAPRSGRNRKIPTIITLITLQIKAEMCVIISGAVLLIDRSMGILLRFRKTGSRNVLTALEFPWLDNYWKRVPVPITVIFARALFQP